MSKKEAAMLGLLAVGGIGAALMISGKGVGEGVVGGGGLGFGEEEPEAMTKKESVTETYAPVGFPTIEAPKRFFETPDFIKQIISPKPTPSSSIREAFRGVSSSYDVSTTFTGTASTPAFVQKDIYHKTMLARLGLSSPAVTKKSPVTKTGVVSHTMSKSGMHTVTKRSKTGAISKKAYRR
jgi:hypothetical protein